MGMPMAGTGAVWQAQKGALVGESIAIFSVRLRRPRMSACHVERVPRGVLASPLPPFRLPLWRGPSLRLGGAEAAGACACSLFKNRLG